MNKKLFTSILVSFFGLFIWSSALAAVSISVSTKPYLANVSISGADPSQNITIYVSNDQNLNKDTYNESKSVLTDDSGNASAEFIVSPNKSFKAYTSLSNTPYESFTTPRESTSTQATISSFSPKSGPVGTEITIVGTNMDNSLKSDNLIGVSIGDYAVIPKTNFGGMMTVTVPVIADAGNSKITIKTRYFGTATSNDYFEVTKPLSNGAPVPGNNANGSKSNNSSSSTSNKSITFSGLVPRCNVSGSAIDERDPSAGGTGQYVVPCDFNYFMALINRLIKFFLFDIATPFLAIIIIYVAYLFLTSGGSNQTEKAKKVLWNVVIGYIIALASWLVINTIISALGVSSDINTFMDRVEVNK